MSKLAFVDALLRNPIAFVVVKATVVLLFASAAAAIVKSASAARRHLVWLAALAACAWLVVSSPVLPTITIRAATIANDVSIQPPRPVATAAAKSPTRTLATASQAAEQFPSRDGVTRAANRSLPLSDHPLLALWILGCVFLLARHAFGLVGTARLARLATTAHDVETMRELSRVTAVVGVKRSVHSAYSPDIRTPITFGVARPLVLLPADAISWSAERRGAVLFHESAHIARGDWVSQTIGQFACELLWFHPLTWYAFARLRDEAERAADDTVLHAGIPACEYAMHLLDLARDASKHRLTVFTVGMVSTNSLERRFVALFDAARSRVIVTRRVRAFTTSVAVAIVCPLASLRVAPPMRATSALQPSLHNTTAIGASMSRPVRPSQEMKARGKAAVVGSSDVHAPDVANTIATPPSLAIVEHLPPRLEGHPDFSGKWTQDTVMGPTVDFLVNDSTIITQSARAISFQSRGHLLDQPTYERFENLSFDGAKSRGVSITGKVDGSFMMGATWRGDTLVLTSYVVVYFGSGAHDVFSIEKMSLTPDGDTLLNTIVSYADGRERWGGPKTFVLRRSAD